MWGNAMQCFLLEQQQHLLEKSGYAFAYFKDFQLHFSFFAQINTGGTTNVLGEMNMHCI